MKSTETRYRAMLSDDELLRYASCSRRDLLRLPPMQSHRLNRLLDQVEAEHAAKSTAWRVPGKSKVRAVPKQIAATNP